jgi:hypothetical protein
LGSPSHGHPKEQPIAWQTEEEASVKTASYSIIIMALSQTLGPVPGSLLASTYGVPWACTMLGGTALFLTWACLLYVKRLQNMEATQATLML